MRETLSRIDERRARRYRAEGLWGPERVDETVLAHAATRPDAVALVAGTRRLTHGELAASVRAAASRLAALGIRRGDPVVVQLPNDLELVVLTLALSSIGAPPIMTPTALRDYELDHIVRITQPVALAVPEKLARFDHYAMARRLREAHPCVRSLLVSDVDDGDAVGLGALCAPPAPGESLPEPERARLDDPALCLLSNGTTGPPKVIPRLQEAYDYQLRVTPEVAGVDQDTVYLAVMPATHGFVLGCPGILGTLGAGGRVVLGPSTEPEAAFELVERERVTHCTLVPALAERWAAAAEDTEHDLSSLRVIQVGGARPRRGQVEKVPEALGCRVQQCYGMSEGLLNYTALDDPDDVAFDTQGRPVSPADEILVVDETGAPVAPGEVGELLTRGPYTVAGYYADAEANAKNFTEDGFYRTGDLVRLHESGSIIVEGRTRDVINRGGEKIPATELELLAAEHPAVAAAAALGAPHARLGEIVCLYVVCHEGATAPGLKEIRRFLQDRGLARFKLPERLEVVESLPYLGIGKVDKKALRATLAASS
ncbi:2,3-dihydroxybenzoate-AMP ligase [Streptoalloteichus tenebrarius]|uniref:2,3-dihydroxybenzoate-AMP ligase n=1 Tax=Streptoalloteichus tenebrarius (strain ATCC 17920 / DSM 40477 / JCM 4838 / CBS 697.72 / NBRC 16177 / NCIMB 11028 / NRRL B-12390 / A12253. 1 / ISP 5477) TaxID=1933 RepID=A0ABT1HLJ2_STRSD|nr:AMP-binding protein [Streptoalloteichus tenebrarius]MCP2256368.1 2,3-dihydroxybenzoate-AMP ligase [Streptoalloteichus tenebrarius]BFF04710.1 (2,3-dihydroxybenzoyl)adenylate synthase [Streptoalloteichus tenebrarius]